MTGKAGYRLHEIDTAQARRTGVGLWWHHGYPSLFLLFRSVTAEQCFPYFVRKGEEGSRLKLLGGSDRAKNEVFTPNYGYVP